MEIQVLNKFQLKIAIIGEAVAKKVIFTRIWPIFRPSLAQVVSQIAKFERISNFYDLKRVNTRTGRDSAQNYHNW